jgi:nitric oxide reductase large subunit
MKIFLKNFLLAIPLAIGVVLTVLSVVNAMEAPNDEDNAIAAVLWGIIGIPLLFASIVSLTRRTNA